MKEWIRNTLQKIDDYYSANEKKEIRKLNTLITTRNNTISFLKNMLSNTIIISDKKEELINDLTNTITSLNNTTTFNKMFKEKKNKYNWKPGKRIYLHESLNNFSEDTEYQEKYVAFLQELGFQTTYNTIDKAVYKIVVLAQHYINDTLPDDYKSDKEAFGTSEYWLSPQEAFDRYVTGEDVGDCEDTSAFLYGCIISGLNLLGYDWTNTLLRIDINFPVAHAIIAYRKQNGVWTCIESTYGENRFSKNWIRDKDMFKGVYTGIWHIFDEETEYELIYSYQR